MIEVEFRSLLGKKKYKDLYTKLLKEAHCDLWDDDKNVFFFILPDKLLKITHNISKKTAKITLKLNKIGNWAVFKEIEIPIATEDIGIAVDIFKGLWFNNTQESFQKRHNFIYNWVEIALKHSNDRWYHLELEIIVKKTSEAKKAKTHILKIAEELWVQVMSDKQLRLYTAKIDKKHNPQESLIQLAARKSLPENQYIDKETIARIRRNYSKQSHSKVINNNTKQLDKGKLIKLISTLFPKSNWFVHKQRVSSIHWQMHHMRVMIYAYLLCHELSLNKKETLICLLASIIHDIKRKNDKDDLLHSKRCSDRIGSESDIIWLTRHISKVNKEYLIYIINNHDIPYSQIKKDKEYEQYEQCLHILKTADALDRYRLPKLKWRLNEDQLILIPSLELKDFAHALTIRSETFFLKWLDAQSSIILSLNKLL